VSVARVERSETRKSACRSEGLVPDFAALNPGYGLSGAIADSNFSATACTAIPDVSTVTRARA